METKRTTENGDRLRQMRDILTLERTLAMERIREFRRDEEQDALPPAADEMDVAPHSRTSRAMRG